MRVVQRKGELRSSGLGCAQAIRVRSLASTSEEVLQRRDLRVRCCCVQKGRWYMDAVSVSVEPVAERRSWMERKCFVYAEVRYRREEECSVGREMPGGKVAVRACQSGSEEVWR